MVFGTGAFITGFLEKIHEGLRSAVKEGDRRVGIVLVVLPYALCMVGPTLIWKSSEPIREALGTDAIFCCERGVVDWAQSPDSRWLILHDGSTAMIIDLEKGEIVRWPRGTESRLFGDVQDSGSIAPNNERQIVPAAPPKGEGTKLVLTIYAPDGNHTVDASLPVPTQIGAEFSRSWTSPSNLTESRIRESNVIIGTLSRKRWLSGNGKVAMTWDPAVQNKMPWYEAFTFGIWEDLQDERRRRVVFSDARTDTTLRETRLAYLPRRMALGVDQDATTEDPSWLKRDLKEEGGELVAVSNYTGSWWAISNRGYIKLVHVPRAESLDTVTPTAPATLQAASNGTSSMDRIMELSDRTPEGPQENSGQGDTGAPHTSTETATEGGAWAHVSYPTATIEELKAAVEHNDIAANTELGVRYLTGKGIEKNTDLALKYLLPGLEARDPRAITNLGWMLTLGQGMPRNDAKAMVLFSAAAKLGYPNAEDSLGFMYEHGRGVPMNLDVAASWYRKASEQGFAKATVNLQRLSQQ